MDMQVLAVLAIAGFLIVGSTLSIPASIWLDGWIRRKMNQR